MKKLIAATILILAVLVNSCEPAATFDKPQPENAISLTSFSAHLQGKYLSADQASIVTISNILITRYYDFDFKEHKDSLGSIYKLAGDTLIDIKDGTKEKVMVNGDTVIQHANWTDTLFNLSAGNMLKKFRGYYFLNILHSEGAWEVKKLSLKNGMLTIGDISGKEDIEKLKAISETAADSVSTHFTLTRKQFKQFVKSKGFSDEETFTRMKETAANK
ncbi:MAG TPA: hypothetical protein VLR29_08485 [Flavobacterium sp.]|nr:hypothetical protein [Flavobacterium sp.]